MQAINIVYEHLLIINVDIRQMLFVKIAEVILLFIQKRQVVCYLS
jgi:hypothetical protein